MALTKNELKKIYLSISIVVVIICIIGILIITKGNRDEPDVEAAEELPTKVKKENIKKPKKTEDDKPKNTFVPPVIPEKPVVQPTPAIPAIPASPVANVPLDNEKCVEKITANFVEASGHVATIVKNGVQQFKTNCADLLDKDEGNRRAPLGVIAAAGLAFAYASSYFLYGTLSTVATMAGYLAFSK